jgi:hypothetical protein
MTRTLRFTGLWALLALTTLSTFAQNRPMVGTIVDLYEGRGSMVLQMDDAAQTQMTIDTDSVSTTYHGFGTMIAGKPEIFRGSQGFSNLREGDRVEVRAGQREGVYRADQVTLLGRSVPVGTTGVGQTRPPTSSATPMDQRGTGTAGARSGGFVEGTVRQINQREGRLVVQTTTGNRLITINTSRNTPVYYRGEAYRVENLEIGDRIRVEADPRDAQADEITARRIDVTMSVQESGTVPGTGPGGTVTMLEGRVTRVEPGLDYIYVESGRGEVRVDMREAQDERGGIVRARDIRSGENVSISGSYNRVGDMFLASTVRWSAADPGTRGPGTSPGTGAGLVRYGLVTLTGTIVETLEDASTLGFRDRETNQVVRIWVADAFVARTKGTTYVTAESLRVNDTAVISAYRDADGNLIAQTIRLRNR